MGCQFGEESSFLLGVTLLLAILLMVSGCGHGGKETTENTTEKEGKSAMKLFTEAFKSGEKIPDRYTCTGEDVSPPLIIENVGADAETLVVVVDDPDAPAGVFDHLLIWNIPADTTQIPEAIPPQETVKELEDAVQGTNDFGEVGYRGPCPPSGSKHKYRFKLYSLDKKLELKPGSRKEKLLEAMEDHILERALLTGFYSR